ncbi:MAG: hypothetical protein IKX36_05720 [Prevotella sp.]|nr:hypothetical protein [Prevotella sp.]
MKHYYLTVTFLVSFIILFGCKRGNETRHDSSFETLNEGTPIDISKWTCQEPDDTLHVTTFSVFIYRPEGMMNKNDVICDEENCYQAYIGCSYTEGHLNKACIYGTEGYYEIDKEEVKRDWKEIPLDREISIIKSEVYDLEKRNTIYKNRGDSIFCFDNDNLVLYVISK